ncbi:hypothetical protein [uncultured Chitinophaga sp.]|jgi:Clostripain family.|uniref:hypothetical protein n=1 Tax=uncultured Chitinophaga sp. TaxID=339340 RepID=UPI002624D0D4|nr:hypothetical protein [uncultured Chitinophaga sp.]
MPDPHWTVSIIAQYTESDEYIRICYNQLIQSILQHRNRNVKFYLLKYHKETEVTNFISYDLVSENEDRVPHTTQPKSTKNFYDSPEVIIEFFSDFSLRHENDHHFLISWGHGSGFGLFREGMLPELKMRFIKAGHENGAPYPEKDEDEQLLEAIQFYHMMLSSGIMLPQAADATVRAFGSFLESKQRFYLNKNKAEMVTVLRQYFRVVSMRDFAFAINRTFGARGVKVDFMYTMNCYMQMFETGYLLKDNVRYFAGAENFQPFPGPDYDALFSDLGATYAVEQPDLDQLSKSIIDHHKAKYTRHEVEQLLLMESGTIERVRLHISETCLVVTRPPLYEALRVKLDELAALLMANEGELYLTIQKARKKCLSVTTNNYGIIDIAHFCTKLLEMPLPDGPLADCLQSVIDIITTPGRLVAEIKKASGLCDPIFNPLPQPTICPNGISIFFPKDKRNSRRAQYVHYIMQHVYLPQPGARPNVFLADSIWDQFVASYFSAELPND